MYHEEMPTATADRLAFTYPNKVMREFTNRATYKLIDGSPGRFDALEKAGFKLDRKGDIYNNLYARFGGHYVDVGTSDRIAKGQIKMKSDSLVKEWTEEGLLFEDGSEIKADVIVLATGFNHDFREGAAQIVGEDIADAHDDYFGIDPEGEVRGAFKIAGRKSSCRCPIRPVLTSHSQGSLLSWRRRKDIQMVFEIYCIAGTGRRAW